MSETQNLNSIVNVEVYVSPLAAPRPSFNQGLILGTSTVITANERIKLYTSLADMLDDGFEDDSPEYLAATLYFAQSPSPTKLWVGRQDLTASETPLIALQACRTANHDWYAAIALAAIKADHIAIAAYIESALPASIYMFTTDDADVLAGTTGNVLETLKGSSYTRSFGQYSTADYAVAAILGYAMGANTGLANSAYTLKFKQEIGITAESLTPTQISVIENNNGNLYLSYAGYYTFLEQGVMSGGRFFDEIINLDMLISDIQLSVMDLLYQNTKIPQTEAGVAQIINAVNRACNDALNRGFLGSGTWTGTPILNLDTGDPMPLGYVVQSVPLSEQSLADRQARKAPTMYVAIKEAGAVHSVLIGVYVDR